LGRNSDFATITAIQSANHRSFSFAEKPSLVDVDQIFSVIEFPLQGFHTIPKPEHNGGAVCHEIPLSPILRIRELSRFLVTGTAQE
jgi:hypothetical protein